VAGTGRVVHITGEAGIGKSNLLAEGMRELDRLGVTPRCCTADETDRRRRLAVVRALLPELDRHVDPDPVGATVAAAERLAADRPLALVADDVHWADDESGPSPSVREPWGSACSPPPARTRAPPACGAWRS
jgi:hypothetical protein